MILSLIAAASENDVIGKNNALPWHLPGDLKHFRDLTRGHPILMGRRTFESIGRVLPDRLNIVLTHTPIAFAAHPDLAMASSIDDALEIAKKRAGEHEELFVIGGGKIYEQTIGEADRIYLTRVHTTVDGDAFFPKIDSSRWQKVFEELHEPDSEHAFAYTFENYERQ